MSGASHMSDDTPANEREDDYADEIADADEPSYRAPGEIGWHELPQALSSLYLLGDDLYLRLQITNIGIVDQFITDLEYHVLRRLNAEERTPADDATFLNAQSQMWIFATYELLRTWKQRAKEVLTLARNGKLATRITDLEADQGYVHAGREARAGQLRDVLNDTSLLARIEDDLRRAHIPFRRLAFIRMALAKHEVAKQKHSIAHAPGYGRINIWCGSLDYQMDKGQVILGNISRRDIADELRAMKTGDAPSKDDIERFDDFMDFDPVSPFGVDN